MSKASVFISYSHKDEIWKDRLLTHLRVFEEEGLLETWDDRHIGAGADWLPTIEQAMASAKVAILLISADFLISEFIRRKEVPTLLERRANEGLCIFPVIVRACVWKKIPWLAKLQARPLDGKPLADRRGARIETHLAEIAAEVWELIQRTTDSGEGILTKEPGHPELSSDSKPSKDLLVAPDVRKLDPNSDPGLKRESFSEIDVDTPKVLHSESSLTGLSSEMANEPPDTLQTINQAEGSGINFPSPDTEPFASSDQIEAPSLLVSEDVEVDTPEQYTGFLVAPDARKLDPSHDLNLEKSPSEIDVDTPKTLHSESSLAGLSSELVNEPPDTLRTVNQAEGAGLNFPSSGTEPFASSDQIEASSLPVSENVEVDTSEQYTGWRRLLKHPEYRAAYAWSLAFLLAVLTMAIISKIQTENYFQVDPPRFRTPPSQSMALPMNSTTAPSSKPLAVTLDFRGDCWVEIMIDKKPSIAELRIQGESMTVEAQKSITLTLGNAGVVDILVNGRPLLLNKKVGETVRNFVIDLDTVKKLGAGGQ